MLAKIEWQFVDRKFLGKDNWTCGKFCCQENSVGPTPFKEFIICTLFTPVSEIHQLFRWELVADHHSYYWRNSKSLLFNQKSKKESLFWIKRPGTDSVNSLQKAKFYQKSTLFPQLLSVRGVSVDWSWSFKSLINMQTLWHHTFRSGCCCSCCVVLRFFKCWYLWNQIRYRETVNGFIQILHVLLCKKEIINFISCTLKAIVQTSYFVHQWSKLEHCLSTKHRFGSLKWDTKVLCISALGR